MGTNEKVIREAVKRIDRVERQRQRLAGKEEVEIVFLGLCEVCAEYQGIRKCSCCDRIVCDAHYRENTAIEPLCPTCFNREVGGRG